MWTRIVAGDVASNNTAALLVDQARLLEQPSLMAGMVEPFYGPAAWRELEQRMVSGLNTMVSMFERLRDRNEPEVIRLSAGLNVNSNELAADMARLNAQWDRAKLGALIQGHRALSIEQAKAVIAGDAKRAAELLDEVAEQVPYLAEAWGSGIGKDAKLPMCV